jgi:hypothetical protein
MVLVTAIFSMSIVMILLRMDVVCLRENTQKIEELLYYDEQEFIDWTFTTK